MDGCRKLVEERKTGRMGHQINHQGHWDDAGPKAKPSWCKTWQQSGPRGMGAMADGEELAGARGFTPRDHYSGRQRLGERERGTGKLTTAKPKAGRERV
jgi:hypothetical protein